MIRAAHIPMLLAALLITVQPVLAEGPAPPAPPSAAPASSVSPSPAAPPASPASPSSPSARRVLDSVIAVINGGVILESDVQEEMRFAVLQPGRAEAARDTPQNALRRLIDRDLILQQMKETRAGTQPPSPPEVQKQVAELRKQIPECAQYHCETEAGWRAFLAAHDLTEKEVEDHWRQRMWILVFIQTRFGAGVQISDAEVEQYYQQNLVPAFAKRRLNPPPLATVSARIREILLQQHVNVLLQDWLQSLKNEGSVSILDPAYAEAVVSTTAQNPREQSPPAQNPHEQNAPAQSQNGKPR